MKYIIAILILFVTALVFAQDPVAPNSFPLKNTPEATDEIYSRYNDTAVRIPFSVAREYFGATIITQATAPAESGNGAALQNKIVEVTGDGSVWFVDADGNGIQLGGGTDDQTAAEVSYDNTSSGLATSTVQGAIDLLENEIDAVSSGASDGVATAGALDVPNQEIDITVASPGSNFSIPLALLPTLSGFSGWDQDASDDFDGAFSSLTGVPSGLDDGDNQALSLSSNTLSLTNGGSVDLSTYLDNTDTQDLSLSGTTLSLTDGGSVDLSVIQDGTGTDDQTAAEVSYDNTSSGLATSTVQGAIDLLENEIDAVSSGASDGVATAGALDVPNQEIDITVASPGSNFSIPLALLPTLSGFSGWDQDASDDFDGAFSSLTGVPSGLDDGDNQALSLSSNTLSLTNGGSVDLSIYLDNTDTQDLSLSGTTLSLTDGGSVDLSVIQDGTGTDSQTLSLSGANLSISGGNTISLAGLGDGTGTDDQTASEVPYTDTYGFGKTDLQGAVDSLIQEVQSLRDDIVKPLSSSGTITANLTNRRGRIFQVNLTQAPSPSTLVVNNPREAGVYTFQFIGVTNNDVAFPANFYNADETSLGTVTFTASDFITCLFDGANFYCK